MKFRSHGGTDDPSNMVTLCGTCHGMVHGGGLLRIAGSAEDGLVFRNRLGEVLARVPGRGGGGGRLESTGVDGASDRKARQ